MMDRSPPHPTLSPCGEVVVAVGVVGVVHRSGGGHVADGGVGRGSGKGREVEAFDTSNNLIATVTKYTPPSEADEFVISKPDIARVRISALMPTAA